MTTPTLTISYDQIVALADQLTPEQKAQLVRHLSSSRPPEMTPEERQAAFDAMMISVGGVLPAYSDKREDWYGDDGR